jgi:hypothetical protein
MINTIPKTETKIVMTIAIIKADIEIQITVIMEKEITVKILIVMIKFPITKSQMNIINNILQIKTNQHMVNKLMRIKNLIIKMEIINRMINII